MAQHYDAMHGGARNMGGTLENMVSRHPHEQQETMQLLTKKKATLLACTDKSCACGRAAKKTGGKRKAGQE